MKPVLIVCLVLLMRTAAMAVQLSEAQWGGVACYKVTTRTCTYYYDKVGAGLAGMVDTDGKDWISYSKSRGGASGEYRGIPNMAIDVFGHPGYTGATSTTQDAKDTQLPKVTIVSTKGNWRTTWEFWETHARMVIHSIGGNYWILYEGTPGGAVGSDDICYRSNDAQGVRLNGTWSGDITNTSGAAIGSEWVYFADGTQNRSLFLMHKDDTKPDSYYLMEPMTVFGFGRGWMDMTTANLPDTLIVGLVDKRAYNDVKQHLDAIWKGNPTSLSGPIPVPLTLADPQRHPDLRILDVCGRTLRSPRTDGSPSLKRASGIYLQSEGKAGVRIIPLP